MFYSFLLLQKEHLTLNTYYYILRTHQSVNLIHFNCNNKIASSFLEGKCPSFKRKGKQTTYFVIINLNKKAQNKINGNIVSDTDIKVDIIIISHPEKFRWFNKFLFICENINSLLLFSCIWKIFYSSLWNNSQFKFYNFGIRKSILASFIFRTVFFFEDWRKMLNGRNWLIKLQWKFSCYA